MITVFQEIAMTEVGNINVSYDFQNLHHISLTQENKTEQSTGNVTKLLIKLEIRGSLKLYKILLEKKDNVGNWYAETLCFLNKVNYSMLFSRNWKVEVVRVEVFQIFFFTMMNNFPYNFHIYFTFLIWFRYCKIIAWYFNIWFYQPI